MRNRLQHIAPLLLLLSLAGCGKKQEQYKGLAATHPKLAEELAADSLTVPYGDSTSKQLYNDYLITTEEYLHSDKYAAGNTYSGRLAPLDESSHPDAQTYRTLLRKGMEEGVNFAGKYTVVSIGCGTGCQTHYVVDRETGKVLDKVQSSMGAKYNKDSRLLIVNPPDSTVDYKLCNYCTPVVYEFVNGKFRELQ